VVFFVHNSREEHYSPLTLEVAPYLNYSPGSATSELKYETLPIWVVSVMDRLLELVLKFMPVRVSCFDAFGYYNC